MDVIDSDVLIDIQRGHPPAVAWFQGLSEFPAVAGFVVMELIQDAKNGQQVKDVLNLVAPFPVVWPSEGSCSQALAWFSTLHLSHGIGLLDALIAACAVQQGGRLLTFNTKHYRMIPGLTLFQPYTR